MYSFNADMCHSTTEADPWLSVQVADGSIITSVKVTNRGDCCDRLSPYEVWVGSAAGATSGGAQRCGGTRQEDYGLGETFPIACEGYRGGYVTVLLPGGSRILNLAEVEVFGYDPSFDP